jgi:hypothetical protein
MLASLRIQPHFFVYYFEGDVYIMNQYYITVKENRYGMYDFIIELFNPDYMEEKATLGNRENVDTLRECLEMIETFPLSESSELTTVTLRRRNKIVMCNKLEQMFINGVNDLKESKGIKEIIIN